MPANLALYAASINNYVASSFLLRYTVSVALPVLSITPGALLKLYQNLFTASIAMTRSVATRACIFFS